MRCQNIAQYLRTLRGRYFRVLGKYNHVYFVLFFLVLFYLGLTADYTNIVASCVGLPIWTCKPNIAGEVDDGIHNMSMSYIYNELIQIKILLCVCKPFPIGFMCMLARYDLIQTLSPLIIVWWSIPSKRWVLVWCCIVIGLLIPILSEWWDPHSEHDGKGSLAALSLQLWALHVWRDFSLGCHSGFQ